MRRAWIVFVACVAAEVTAYFVLPTGSQVLVYDLIGITAGAVVAAAVLFGRTAPRAPWLLVGLGVLAFALGDVVYGESQPVPSLADMFYISAYPLLAVGLWGLGSRRRVSQLSTSLSALLITGMVVFVSWVFIFLPGPNGYGAEVITKAVALGYPLLDVVLFVLLARAIAAQGELPGTYVLFGAAILLLLAADIAFAMQDFGMSYSAGQYIDASWLIAYAGFGASALHPSAWAEVPVPRADADVAHVRVVGVGYLRDVRFRDVLRWSGRALLLLSAVAIACGAAWHAPDVAILGGTYGTTGGVMYLVVELSGDRSPRTLPKLKRADLRSAA